MQKPEKVVESALTGRSSRRFNWWPKTSTATMFICFETRRLTSRSFSLAARIFLSISLRLWCISCSHTRLQTLHRFARPLPPVCAPYLIRVSSRQARLVYAGEGNRRPKPIEFKPVKLTGSEVTFGGGIVVCPGPESVSVRSNSILVPLNLGISRQRIAQ